MRAALLEGAPLGTVAPELLVLAVMGVDLSEWVVVWGGPPYTVGQAATLLELGILVASRAQPVEGTLPHSRSTPKGDYPWTRANATPSCGWRTRSPS